MQIAHLILAHNNPQQLERLISRLTHPGNVIYVHIDKKTDIKQFEHLRKLPNVFFISNRVKIHWGSYNMIEATLIAFKEIINSGLDFKFVNLLSGQDYPIQPIKVFNNFLSNNPESIFMSYLVFETDWHEAIARINQYHFTNYEVKGRYIFQRIINKILPERVFPHSLIPVGRSQWFTIPLESVKYIMEYWNNNKNLQKFIKLTWAPDEFIFQTILYNSVYRDKIVNENLRFMKWSPAKASPDLLKTEDLKLILDSGKFFARKFDSNIENSILDLIDEHIYSDSI